MNPSTEISFEPGAFFRLHNGYILNLETSVFPKLSGIEFGWYYGRTGEMIKVVEIPNGFVFPTWIDVESDWMPSKEAAIADMRALADKLTDDLYRHGAESVIILYYGKLILPCWDIFDPDPKRFFAQLRGCFLGTKE